jgi:hypothetical protein
MVWSYTLTLALFVSVLHMLMVSADRLRPPKTALNNNHTVGMASALSHSAAEYAFL